MQVGYNHDDKVQVGYKKLVPPPTFAGYKNDLYGNPLYDDTLAVSVYIADALVSTAEVIKIPLRILENNLSVAQRDGVNGHYSQWVLLHPTPGTNIQQHVLIGTYYRSPNNKADISDIYILRQELRYISSQYYYQYIILDGDFNFKHSLYNGNDGTTISPCHEEAYNKSTP